MQKRDADVERLDLRNNGIPAAAAPHIADIITKGGSSGLRHLDVGMNELGDEGAAAIAKALEGNTSLTHLALPNNGLTAGGVATLMAALKGNSTLETLDLGCAACAAPFAVACNPAATRAATSPQPGWFRVRSKAAQYPGCMALQWCR